MKNMTKDDIPMPSFHWLTWTVIGLLLLLCVSILLSWCIPEFGLFTGSLAGVLWYFFLFAFIWVVACIIGGGIKSWLEKYLNLLFEENDQVFLADEYIRIHQKMDRLEEKIDRIEKLLIQVSE
jgi:hypothetical protein